MSVASPRSLADWREASPPSREPATAVLSPAARPGRRRARVKAVAILAAGAGAPIIGTGMSQPGSHELLALALVFLGASLYRLRRQGRRDSALEQSAMPADTGNAPIVGVFTPWCDRAGQRLKACRLSWVCVFGEGVEALQLPAESTSGLLRVAQAALDEVMRKRSQAGEVRLEINCLHGETGSHLRLVLTDGSRAGTGWLRDLGLPMVQREATRMGAQLEITTDAQGWCVELVLPLKST